MESRVIKVSRQLLESGVIEERLLTEDPIRTSISGGVESVISIEQDINNAVRHFGLANGQRLIRNSIDMLGAQTADVGIGIGLLTIAGASDPLDSTVRDLLSQAKTGMFARFGRTERIVRETTRADSESYLHNVDYIDLSQALNTRYTLDRRDVEARFAIIGLQRSLNTIDGIRGFVRESMKSSSNF